MVLRSPPRPHYIVTFEQNSFSASVISRHIFLTIFVLLKAKRYITVLAVCIGLSSRCLPRYLVTKLLQQQSAYLPSLTLIATESPLHLFTGNFRKDTGECFSASFPLPCTDSSLKAAKAVVKAS